MAAIDLARLVVTLEAQNTKYLKQLEASQRRLKKFEKQTKKSSASINNLFKGVAVGLVVRGVTRMVNETREAIDTQAKFADVIGLTTEQFAGYQLAAKISGVEMNQLNTGLTRFQKNIADAESGMATAKREFDKLGLSAENLKKLSTDEQLKVIADRFTSLNSTVDKSSVLLNLFGRSGIALGKLLEQGSGAIDRYQEEAVKLGIALSRLDAAKVEAANDALTRANEVFEGAKNRIVVGLSPALQGAAELYREMALEAADVGDSTGILGDVAIAVFGEIGDSVQDISLFIVDVKANVLGLAATIVGAGAKIDKALSFNGLNKHLAATAEQGEKLAAELRALANEAAAAYDKGFAERIEKGKFSDRLVQTIKQQQEQLIADAEAAANKPTVASASIDTAAIAKQEAALKAIKTLLDKAQPALDKYNDSVATAKSFLESGALTQQEYNSVLAVYKQRLDDATGVTDKFKAELSDAAGFIEASKTELEKLNEELARAQELAGKGLISEDVLARTTERIAESAKELDAMSVFADQAARNMQDAFADFLFDPFQDGLDGMLAGFLKVIQRMLAEQLAAQIFGSKSDGGFGLGDVVSGLFSADGGGFTGSGPRTGGVDGKGGFPAILHPQETVIDHTRNLSGMPGKNAAAPIVNVPPPEVIIVDSMEAAYEAMASPRGSNIQIDNAKKNSTKFNQSLGNS